MKFKKKSLIIIILLGLLLGIFPYNALAENKINITSYIMQHVVGIECVQQLVSVGGSEPYTYNITSGVLPTGMKLSDSGVLSGAPLKSGYFRFTVTAKDKNGITCSREYEMAVLEQKISIDPEKLQDAKIGEIYSQQFTAGGGVMPYTYSASGFLPTGMSLSSSGMLSGVPSESGEFSFNVAAMDNNGYAGRKSYRFSVNSPQILLEPDALAEATLGLVYNVKLNAAGGTSLYRYTVSAGSLPKGIKLDTAGILSGIPGEGGIYNFTVTIADSTTGNGPYSINKSYTLIVNSPSKANMDRNIININPLVTKVGEKVTIIASGDRQKASGVIIGDDRYIPLSWEIEGTDIRGNFNEDGDKYISDYTALTPGDYTIIGNYKKQTWDGNTWADNGSDRKTAVLKVNPLEQVSIPEINHLSGEVFSGTSVMLSCKTEGAIVHYTIDGTVPTLLSPVYDSPIVVREPVVIKAMAVKSGMVDSKVSSESYSIKAPENIAVTSVAEDGCVDLSWSTVQNVVYYEVYKDNVYLNRLDGCKYNCLGLTNGISYGFEVKGINSDKCVIGVGKVNTIPVERNKNKPFQVTVLPYSWGGWVSQENGRMNSDQSNNGVTNNGLSLENSQNMQTAQEKTQGDASLKTLVNGKIYDFGIIENVIDNGHSTVHIKLKDKEVEPVISKEEGNIMVAIVSDMKTDSLIVEFDGQLIKNMQDRNALIEVKGRKASYTMPVRQIKLKEILSKYSGCAKLEDIRIQIEILNPASEGRNIARSEDIMNKVSAIVSPIEFKLVCLFEGSSMEITDFDTYVSRDILLPVGVKANEIAAGVVLESDGSIRYMPTKVISAGDKLYARISSFTNSIYSVIKQKVEFKDAANHWAAKEINELGSRGIINGQGNGNFLPDKGITRSEFVAFIVRALGLKPGIGTSNFADIKPGKWYYDFVKTAVHYKIIDDCDSRSFRPTDKITYSEASKMIERAMKVIVLKENISFLQQSLYKAQKTDGTLTRAEAADMIFRLLKESNLI